MEAFKRISPESAHELMVSKKVVIVDIRDPNSFLQGHIAQAQNISDENIQDFLTQTDKNTPLICCCYHGISSQNAAAFFAHQGFKEVYSIDGGFEGWKKIYA